MEVSSYSRRFDFLVTLELLYSVLSLLLSYWCELGTRLKKQKLKINNTVHLYLFVSHLSLSLFSFVPQRIKKYKILAAYNHALSSGIFGYLAK